MSETLEDRKLRIADQQLREKERLASEVALHQRRVETSQAEVDKVEAQYGHIDQVLMDLGVTEEDVLAWRQAQDAADEPEPDPDNPDGYALWEVGIEVQVDEVYHYNKGNYKVLQAHTTDVDSAPDKNKDLWQAL